MLVMAVVAPAMRTKGIYWVAFSLAGLLVLVGFIVAMLGLFQGSWRAGGVGVTASIGSFLVGLLLAAFTFAPELARSAKESAKQYEEISKFDREQKAQRENRKRATENAKLAALEAQYQKNPELRPRSMPKKSTPAKLATKNVQSLGVDPAPPFVIRKGDFSGGWTYTAIDLDPKLLLAGSCISGNGKWLYLLRKDGTLQQVSVPEFVVKRELKFESASWLAVTNAGLAIARSKEDDIVVVDAATLKIKTAYSLEGVGGLSAGGSSSPYLFVEWDKGLTVRVIDLANGSLVGDLDARDFSREAVSKTGDPNVTPVHFERMLVSLDGKTLFTNYKYRVHRFAINRGNLTWEAVGKQQRKPLDSSNPVVKQWFDELCLNPVNGECYWTEGHDLKILNASGYQGEQPGDHHLQFFDKHLTRVLVHPQGLGFLAGYKPNESVWVQRRNQSGL